MADINWFVGCACDRNFVQHTAVMLTSLAINGDVPEATILIAGFDLEPADHQALRAAVGTIGADVRFVSVTRETLGAVADREWEGHYSLPVFGRLFLPQAIECSGARLLTLDSDMIVNRPVRPLFEMNMFGEYLGAIHDTPRVNDPDYFNSGMMVIDVDTFNRYDVTRRCLRWLEEQVHRPRWPDQDALNHVVGHKWHRLERTWNRAYCGNGLDPDPFLPSFYDKANIAHFTGQTKPWNNYDHRGRQLYGNYLAEFQDRRRLFTAAMSYADTNFVVTACEVLLGREPAGDEITHYKRMSAEQVILAMVHTHEFVAGTLVSLKLDAAFPAGTHIGIPGDRHRGFALDRFPLGSETSRHVETAATWRTMLLALVRDGPFQRTFEMEAMIALAERLKGPDRL